MSTDPDPASATLAAIRAIEQAATKGEWRHRTAEGRGDWTTGAKPISIERVEADARPGGIGIFDAPADAEFTATARTVMPRLLAAIEAVLKRHESRVPVRILAEYGSDEAERYRYCSTCSGHPAWPCPEVRAITAALSRSAPVTPEGNP